MNQNISPEARPLSSDDAVLNSPPLPTETPAPFIRPAMNDEQIVNLPLETPAPAQLGARPRVTLPQPQEYITDNPTPVARQIRFDTSSGTTSSSEKDNPADPDYIPPLKWRNLG